MRNIDLGQLVQPAERHRVDPLQPTIFEVQHFDVGESLEGVLGEVPNRVALHDQDADGGYVLERSGRHRGQLVPLEVKYLEVLETAECIRRDDVDAIADQVDLLKGMVILELVDVQSRQKVVAERQYFNVGRQVAWDQTET